jgi:hypothetical protein
LANDTSLPDQGKNIIPELSKKQTVFLKDAFDPINGKALTYFKCIFLAWFLFLASQLMRARK